MAKNNGPVAGGLVCLRGKLSDEGMECQAFRDDQDTLYTLVGNLGGFKPGDRVVVCGMPVAVSFCQQGTTLAVTSITRPKDFIDTTERVRDVTVKATRSSADHSPVLKLENRILSLNADGKFWVGAYDDVTIVGPLQIAFTSDGWQNQIFDLEVTVHHPSQPGEDTAGKFRRVTKKGEVNFLEEMEL